MVTVSQAAGQLELSVSALALRSMTPALMGRRDPAQPLLTLLDGPARVELSGSTTANWVAKTANLLVDGHGAPHRVGLLLPLHWQPVCFLLGVAATGATVVIARESEGLAGCPLAFTTPECAQDALDAGVEDVLVISGHPLGVPVAGLPAMVLDAAREIPGYGDRFAGQAVSVPRIEVGGRSWSAGRELGLTAADRVLTVLGLADGLDVLLGALSAGAALVLVPHPATVDLAAAVAAERVTACAGIDLPGVRRV